MSATAGWYLDPSGVPGQLRWWDGARWTDHVTPDPSAVPAAAGAAGADAAVSGPEPSQPPPPTGSPDAAPAWDAGSTGAWGSGDTTRPAWQVDTPVPTSSGSSVRTGLIVAAVVGALVLGMIALGVIGLLRTGSVDRSTGGFDGFDGFDEEVFADDWDSDWDGDVLEGGRLLVGDEVRVELPPDATFEVTVDIEVAGTYAFDARGGGDFDGMMAVHGPEGDLLAEDDDRGEELVDRVGGNWLDPFLELDLGPGEHRVLVRGFAGDGGAFDLVVDPA